jgi:ubiquinone/menaquinone biosynthesis C-methylase UbiE
MELSIAVELIRKGISDFPTNQTWADLGAGRGLFTRALSDLLRPASKVYAVDKDASALDAIHLPEHVQLIRVHQNFENELSVESLDGIIMANSLHFVKNKQAYLRLLSKNLKPGGRLILIEYDTSKPNAWVPYPVRFDDLDQLARQSGLRLIEKLGEVPSAYRTANIYSALLLTEN